MVTKETKFVPTFLYWIWLACWNKSDWLHSILFSANTNWFNLFLNLLFFFLYIAIIRELFVFYEKRIISLRIFGLSFPQIFLFVLRTLIMNYFVDINFEFESMAFGNANLFQLFLSGLWIKGKKYRLKFTSYRFDSRSKDFGREGDYFGPKNPVIFIWWVEFVLFTEGFSIMVWILFLRISIA